jgi:hypothetical protein
VKIQESSSRSNVVFTLNNEEKSSRTWLGNVISKRTGRLINNKYKTTIVNNNGFYPIEALSLSLICHIRMKYAR